MLNSLRSKSPLLSNEDHRNRSPFGGRLPRALRSRDLRMEPLEARHLLAGVHLAPIGSFETGIFDDSAAEIVVHDAATQSLFVENHF